MRKYLIVLAFMMLLMPIIHACSDDGSNGSGDGDPDTNPNTNSRVSIDKSEIDLGELTIGQTVTFEYTVTNLKNAITHFNHTVTLNSFGLETDLEGISNSDNLIFTPCHPIEKILITLAPFESCKNKVTFTVAEPIQVTIPGLPDYIYTASGDNPIETPIKFTIKPN